MQGIEPSTSGFVAKNSYHYTTDTVNNNKARGKSYDCLQDMSNSEERITSNVRNLFFAVVVTA
jgi:hypothetical protein